MTHLGRFQPGETVTLHFLARGYETGLSDAIISIWNHGEENVVDAAAMTEIDTTGIYFFKFKTSSQGNFSARMSSVANDRSDTMFFTVGITGGNSLLPGNIIDTKLRAKTDSIIEEMEELKKKIDELLEAITNNSVKVDDIRKDSESEIFEMKKRWVGLENLSKDIIDKMDNGYSDIKKDFAVKLKSSQSSIFKEIKSKDVKFDDLKEDSKSLFDSLNSKFKKEIDDFKLNVEFIEKSRVSKMNENKKDLDFKVRNISEGMTLFSENVNSIFKKISAVMSSQEKNTRNNFNSLSGEFKNINEKLRIHTKEVDSTKQQLFDLKTTLQVLEEHTVLLKNIPEDSKNSVLNSEKKVMKKIGENLNKLESQIIGVNCNNSTINNSLSIKLAKVIRDVGILQEFNSTKAETKDLNLLASNLNSLIGGFSENVKKQYLDLESKFSENILETQRKFYKLSKNIKRRAQEQDLNMQSNEVLRLSEIRLE